MPELELWYYKARFYGPDARIGGRFLQVDPVGYDDQINLYAYVGNDPFNRADPTGKCAYRKPDGTCEVKVDQATGERGVKAGKELEARLNAYDKTVQKLNPEAKFEIKDSKGKITGSVTGAQIKGAWNNQKFEITADRFKNLGFGETSPGLTRFNPEAVEQYSNYGKFIGLSRQAGVDTLLFHDFSHAFGPGLAAHIANPGAPGAPNPIAERAAHAQGSAIASALNGEFSCQIPALDMC